MNASPMDVSITDTNDPLCISKEASLDINANLLMPLTEKGWLMINILFHNLLLITN